MFMMRTLALLSLFVLFGTLFQCEAVANLRPGGRNVKKTTVSYYVIETTTVKVTKSRQTCTRTCDTRFIWCWSSGYYCRTVYYTTYEPKTVSILKYKIEYVCSDGWQRRSSGDDECLKPICTGGCQNGGTCVSPGNCRCRSGWTGNRCGDDINECNGYHVCEGSCINTDGSYRCTCSAGYNLVYGRRCVAICTGGCQNGGTCVSPDNCRCRSGWTGNRCGDDVDECHNNHDCCYSPAICQNTLGSYRCSCPTGFITHGKCHCINVDECSRRTYSCGRNMNCHDTHGSYTCECLSGYTRRSYSSTSCVDINECNGSHGCESYCINTVGSYKCACPAAGYNLAADGKSCINLAAIISGTICCVVALLVIGVIYYWCRSRTNRTDGPAVTQASSRENPPFVVGRAPALANFYVQEPSTSLSRSTNESRVYESIDLPQIRL